MIRCEKCKRELKQGDDVYESEWNKIDIKNVTAKFTVEKRYECVSCPKGKK